MTTTTEVALITLTPKTNVGKIQVILGPMFSGKTTELLRRLRRHQIARNTHFLIKYVKDNRSGDAFGIQTHDKLEQKEFFTIKAFPVEKLSEVPIREIEKVQVIAIDEGQFFPDIVDFCNKWAMLGKIIIVSALDGTFEQKPFGVILNLIPVSESITKLTAVCMNCGQDASFTQRIDQNNKQLEVIGGIKQYRAVCRLCLVNLKNEQESEQEQKQNRSCYNLSYCGEKKQLGSETIKEQGNSKITYFSNNNYQKILNFLNYKPSMFIATFICILSLFKMQNIVK